MMARLLTIMAIGFVLANTGGADDATRDREKLQGNWKVVKIDTKEEGPREYFQKYGRVVIKGDKLTVMFVEKQRQPKVLEGSFKVNPAKTPKAIDVTIDFISILVPDTKDAQKRLEEMKGKTILGIYALDEDTLKLFFSEVGKQRPKRFPTTRGEGAITVQREKP